MNYMEENMSETLDLEEISRIAGYSVPQFYRLFKQLTGDTVSEYLLRRKMSQASIDLKKTKKTISEIAFQYGFQSHDVFTRAFRRVYGITPNKYRHSNVSLQPLKGLEISEHEDGDEKQQMIFSVKEKKAFQVVGLECKACTWNSDGAIGNTWCEFLARVNEVHRIASPMTMYGICEGETCNENHFIYMAAVAVDSIENVPKGMTVRVIREQKFFQASVPQKINTPDAYTSTWDYAKSLGF